MTSVIVSLILLTKLQVSVSTTYRADNTKYVMVYDDSKRYTHTKASTFCQSKFDTQLATILDEDSQESLLSLYVCNLFIFIY